MSLIRLVFSAVAVAISESETQFAERNNKTARFYGNSLSITEWTRPLQLTAETAAVSIFVYDEVTAPKLQGK